MNQQERSRVIARVYTEWAAELAGNVPLSEYARGGRSQSAEGEEILGADVAAHDELKRRTDAALEAAGLTVEFTPQPGRGSDPRVLPLHTLLQLTPEEVAVTKVKFNNRNPEKEDPLDQYLDNPDLVNDHWLFYRKGQRNFEVGAIAVNLVAFGDHTWLLTTVKKVTKELHVKDGTNYEGEDLDRLAPLFGRVVVRYHRKDRAGVRWLENLGQLEVVQVLPSPFDGEDFPGYDKVRLSFRQLKSILDRGKRDWVAALEGQKAVYLITDLNTGRLYVGSATSDKAMLLDRWRAYADNGHGKNKELESLVNKLGMDYVRAHFQYSILENYNSRVDRNFVLKREQWWKSVLASVSHGYNVT